MFVDITDRVQMEQEKARLEAQNIYLQEEIRSQHNFVEIVGNSPSLLRVLRQVDQVAPTDSTALIFGETGTGKELIARAIHDRSPRRERPLVKVNCGAISAGLVESELFGHVKGAFTGALTNRDGRFALADGGTIFLDEVGELPPETQVKLLRVLQEQEFEPIGGSKTIKVDVRVIAATNRDLAAMVREGKFRSDLFYRLNVVPGDHAAAAGARRTTSRCSPCFSSKNSRASSAARSPKSPRKRWRGSARMPGRAISASCKTSSSAPSCSPAGSIAARGRRRAARHAPRPATPLNVAAPIPCRRRHRRSREAGGASLEEVERQHIIAVLKQANWRIEGNGGAAKILNLEPSTLRSRMKKLGIVRGV